VPERAEERTMEHTKVTEIRILVGIGRSEKRQVAAEKAQNAISERYAIYIGYLLKRPNSRGH